MQPEAGTGGARRRGRTVAAAPLRLHASCVALGGAGVLLRGPSGAGKSDMALRLIDRGAVLVADDQVLIEAAGASLIARAPAVLHGLLEVRGVGILRLDAAEAAPLALVVDLARGARGERLPAPTSCRLRGRRLPLIRIDPSAPSAAPAIQLSLTAERVW